MRRVTRKDDPAYGVATRRAVQTIMGIATLGLASAGRAEDAAGVPSQANVETPTRAEIERLVTYAIGDTLKITVFEQLRSDSQGGEERRDLVASAVERPELSGEYVVQNDGSIYVPLAGSVGVAGTSFQDLDRALSTVLSSKLNGSVRVGIRLMDREPVYVVGHVARSGPYKYVPGMSVLHALALAGAVEVAPQDRWRLLDIAREKERLLKSTERLNRSLARIAILVAERDTATVASRRLADLVGATAAKARLGEAETFRRIEQAKRRKQEAAIDAAVQSYQAELAIQRGKLAQVEANIDGRNLRMDHLTKLRERGATTDVSYYAGLTELGDAKERMQDTKVMVAQTERRISDLLQDRLRNTIEVEVDREREIRELQAVIDEEELTRAALNAALAPASAILEGQSGSRRDMSLTILRRTQWGLRRQPAQEDSLLEPGDVLQIVPAQPARTASQ